MSEIEKVTKTQFDNVYECIFNDGTTRLCTKNLSPGHNVYGERLIKYGGVEYREWNAFRSKLAGAIVKGLKYNPIVKGSKILYLGAASGTTPSHISDIVELQGKVYSVEFSPRVIRELLLVAQYRPNMFPILADARFPQYYKSLVENVDIVYVDIAQPNETEIAMYNARFFLKKNGYMMIAIKSRSIDVTKDPREIYNAEAKKLEDAGFDIREVLELDPYDKDHAMIVVKYK
ncbi:fibrillarin-like rRNA/tRNA 2'-O-methyltransferase [Sulfolobus acidocaldarius]|uniref:Fibrillarin-like rRNA/tRNA 2'-O-methyltransferase n=4 Tax=Sulfolobus acidocaldarius TaxID=2285 RepID=FLPA_SULAC|nr:fibrillarin-like rRNA/tRNA 2'-O-methyltransferase [Sulfolobus acidocaldarius]Q9P9M0.1 RecName: Full=Fibrillarin-like rRNA/tRNA 2'-O-methyltransferase [Sulfolobus acidocaldarius DSM 639]AHC51613.1 SAM-dependent methyltransferase [Sulfolobus acidocaldarius SUSAZ]AAF69254.1 fibrillarin homolog [Sulfolobus acidocaldarius]AAY80681.1 fribrillarin-like pre-rRNA processing protein [Sulfolobus acidocaldarius DSM 639]AGE71278.1 fibrillarin [Sulfolobus acidocaldarius N8]AGE73547.1 fibrillarin [Sulfol